MALDVSLASYLSATVPNGTPVYQNNIPQGAPQPRIWFKRRSQDTELFLGGSTGLNDVSYDLEVSGLDIDAVENLAEAVRSSLHGHNGVMGLDTVLAVFVSDVSDDYIPKSLGSDEGFNVVALDIQVLQ